MVTDSSGRTNPGTVTAAFAGKAIYSEFSSITMDGVKVADLEATTATDTFGRLYSGHFSRIKILPHSHVGFE